MERCKWNLLLIFLVASSQATAGEARVVAQIASHAQFGTPSLVEQTLNFPEDVDFSLRLFTRLEKINRERKQKCFIPA